MTDHTVSSTATGDDTPSVVTGHTIPKPPDERLAYRAESERVVGAARPRFDLPATVGGALAALGTLLLLSSVVAAATGTIGYLSGVDGEDLSVGGLIGGLLVLLVACLVGGWVAGRIARHRGWLHGLVAIGWLVVLAAVLAALAAVASDEFDLTDRIGLPDWFSSDALTGAAIATGLLALALMLLGGWLGGRLADRHHHDAGVEVVETRHHVSEHAGGIHTEERR